jgi:hypothetical protein
VRAANDARLVARKGGRHDDIGHEEAAAIGGPVERFAHRVSGDAVGSPRADDDARPHRLDPAVRVSQLDAHAVCVFLDLGRGGAPLDGAPQRDEMLLENSLRLILRQTAVELATAVDAGMVHRADQAHVRAIQPRGTHVLGRLEKRRQEADALENFESAGLDSGCPRLAVRLEIAFDQPRPHAVACQFRGREQARRPRADD